MEFWGRRLSSSSPPPPHIATNGWMIHATITDYPTSLSINLIIASYVLSSLYNDTKIDYATLPLLSTTQNSVRNYPRTQILLCFNCPRV